MYKFFLSILIVLVFSVTLVPLTFAQENTTVSAKLKNGGSYEVFWPLVAGKTMDEPLYFLKQWKEDVGGMFIFDEATKADYKITLATKRLLEVDKLLKDKKESLAVKTLDRALLQFSGARSNIDSAKEGKNNFSDIKINLINQLSNLNTFVPKLREGTEGEIKFRLDKVLENVEQFLNELR